MSILVVLTYVYLNDFRCIFIGQSNQFLKTQNNNITIYSSIDTPKDTLLILHDAIREGSKINESFWGKKLDKVIVIYCHNQSLYKKYGQKGTAALTRLGTYVIVPATGLEAEILSHEFCHAEIFNNVGRSWWVYYQRLPIWFDEGIALQFNNNGIYSEKSLASIKSMSLKELRKIDKPRYFYTDNYNQVLHHYCVSKIEISRWLSIHNKEDLFKVFKALKDGKDFYEAYSNP